MNKIKKIISILFVSVLALSMFTACSKEEAKDPIVGTWQAISVQMGDVTIDEDQLKQFGEESIPTFTFSEDGKYSATATDDQSVEGTWLVNGDRYDILDPDGNVTKGTIEGGKLIMENDDAVVTLKKKE